jgi:flavin-binding protein dodecin
MGNPDRFGRVETTYDPGSLPEEVRFAVNGALVRASKAWDDVVSVARVLKTGLEDQESDSAVWFVSLGGDRLSAGDWVRSAAGWDAAIRLVSVTDGVSRPGDTVYVVETAEVVRPQPDGLA